jgi:hypothetical protein
MNLYKYIKSLRKEVHNLSDHTYVRTKIFGSFITLLFIEVYMKDVILEYANRYSMKLVYYNTIHIKVKVLGKYQ